MKTQAKAHQQSEAVIWMHMHVISVDELQKREVWLEKEGRFRDDRVASNILYIPVRKHHCRAAA